MMNNKKRLFIILSLVLVLGLSSYATFSRYAKKISKEGSINTADVSYCQSKGITSLKECLIRNDSQKELAEALNAIDERSVNVNFNTVEPVHAYVSTRKYTDVTNKTSTDAIKSTTSGTLTYVIENKLIEDFNADDPDIKNISFSKNSGFYSLKNYKSGNLSDVVTTKEDMENGIYKYSCIGTITTNECVTLFLVTEEPYNVSGSYRFKQGYTYSYKVNGTSASKPGLYKGEDDYTVDNNTHTYYYRGEVNNNWVKFGNYLWRVVRINGNGTIRMIYAGKASDTNHMSGNSHIGNTSWGDTTSYTKEVDDITGLTNEKITTKYNHGRYANTYVGYMYNPELEYNVYPNFNLSSTNIASKFMLYTNINAATDYYFFENFNPETDCNDVGANGEPGTCTLKCRSLGEDGDEGIDCVQSKWKTISTKEGNFSSTVVGASAANNVYTSDYKYTCWGIGTPVVKENSDGTKSVYISCPVVNEIIGTVKNNENQARVKYHMINSASVDDANKNVKDSKIKTFIDTWYSTNIYGKTDSNNNQLEAYLSDEEFCNDRSSTSTTFPFTNTNLQYEYGATLRSPGGADDKNPSFKCPNRENDAFTLKSSGAKSTVASQGKGNGMLDYPVGLITIDEAYFAGSRHLSMNYKNYLYVNGGFWTMSPAYFKSNSYAAQMFYLNTSQGFIEGYSAASQAGARPVINLKADVLYESGSGTEKDPYIIALNK